MLLKCYIIIKAKQIATCERSFLQALKGAAFTSADIVAKSLGILKAAKKGNEKGLPVKTKLLLKSICTTVFFPPLFSANWNPCEI